MIKAVVFDIGGVLAQDVWEHLYLDSDHGLIARYPGLDPEAIEATGNSLWEKYAYISATQERDWQQLERNYWTGFIQENRDALPSDASEDDFINLTDDFVQPVEGMLDVLKRLTDQELELAICSNNNEFWYERQAHKLKLAEAIPSGNVILSCHVGVSKSSPTFEMFQAVSDSLQCDRAECLFIDDRQGNVDAAKRYGMQSVLFVDAADLSQQLQSLGIR